MLKYEAQIGLCGVLLRVLHVIVARGTQGYVCTGSPISDIFVDYNNRMSLGGCESVL